MGPGLTGKYKKLKLDLLVLCLPSEAAPVV